MKTLFNKIIILSICTLIFSSCEKDETRVVANSEGKSSTLSASTTSLVLKEEEAGNDAITFSWTDADFGYQAAVKYTLEFGVKGKNFAGSKSVDLAALKQKKYKVSELNVIADAIGLPGFKAGEMEVRIKAQISEKTTPVYSNLATITVTPYLSEPEYPTIYMVGDATEFAWDNSKGTPMFRDETDVFVYTYTGFFKAGALKFVGISGKWAPQWGNDGSGGVKFREKESDPDPGVFNVPVDGYYTVKLSLRNNTMSITPFDASTATNYTSIGIIGAFNSWGGIEPMTKSAINPHIWSINYTFSAETEMKFRIAADWSTNWGPSIAKDPKLFSKGVNGGQNMLRAPGTYRILFNDITGHYLFIKQ